jgi:Flp pilus assembly protein TadD
MLRGIRGGILGGILGIAICVGPLAYVAVAQQVPPKGSSRQEAAPIAEELPVMTPALAADQEANLRRELALHSNSAEILYKLGLVLRQENKPKESLETYTHAAQLIKPDANELRSVALDYVLLNDYEDAVHWLRSAAAADPQNAEVLYSLGRCLYTQGRYGEAEEQYLRLLQLQPKHLKAEENLGLAYDANNQPEKAEAALRTASGWVGKDPSDEWPLINLGAFLLDHDKPAEAATFLERAVAIAPKSAIGHEKLGRALGETGKLLDAVKELEIAAGLDPGNPNVHFELGHAYHQAGEQEKARAEFATSQALRKQRDQK